MARRGITSQPSGEGKRVSDSLKGMVTATPFDVCLRGQSGRTGDMAGESVVSQEETLAVHQTTPHFGT